MAEQHAPPDGDDPPGRNPQEPDDRIVDSADLLQGCRWVVIQHRGEKYRLFETRNGRLILQK